MILFTQNKSQKTTLDRNKATHMILFTQNKSQKTTLDRNKATQGDQLLTKTFSIKVLFTWHAASIASISQSFSLVAPQIH